jgi:hypothetical protein
VNNERISKCSSGKKGNLLPPCCPRSVGAVAPAAPVAPAPLTVWIVFQKKYEVLRHLIKDNKYENDKINKQYGQVRF